MDAREPQRVEVPADEPATTAPPPPLQEIEATDTAGDVDATPPPPRTETAGSESGQSQQQKQSPPAAAKAHGDESPPVPATEAEEVAGAGQPQPPSPPVSTTPAPPEPTQQQQQQQQEGDAMEASSAHEVGRKEEPGSSRGRRLLRRFRSVLWVSSLLRRKGSPPSDGAGAPPLPDEGKVAGAGTGDAPAKPKEEEENGSKSGRDEAKAPAPPEPKEAPSPLAEKIKSCLSGAGAEEEGDGAPGGANTPVVNPPHGDGNPPRKRRFHFRIAGLVVKFVVRLKRRLSSRDTGNEAAEEGIGGEDKTTALGQGEGKPASDPAAQGEEKRKQPAPPEEEKQKKPQPRWGKLECRLETILEKAFKKLIAADFKRLDGQRQKCLLTFSVFPLNSQVKKQAVTYWWDAEFDHARNGAGPPPVRAEEIFAELCDGGFLNPIKNNRWSRKVHGCCVNPLVHWTVKLHARDNGFAVLNARGDPADRQTGSAPAVFCLTESNRVLLKKIGGPMSDDSQAGKKPSTTLSSSAPSENPPPSSAPPKAEIKLQEEGVRLVQLNDLIKLTKIQAIINISAHVYRLPDCLLSSLGAKNLVVLQLGRWWNYDDDTYIEVAGLDTLSAIGNLKKLRYLGIRGLSKITELPKEVNQLGQLLVLDMHGCQNLTQVASSTVKTLRRLTHLDLTECYMLEHIGREVTSLQDLKVFKGFVFGIGAGKNRVCRLRDLGAKLKKLEKLSINVTTDANVEKEEMTHLKFLLGLKRLTVTWGELPSILKSRRKEECENFLKKWTNLVLPPHLEKLDVRCYPDKVLSWKVSEEFKKHTELKKVYVRGGLVERLEVPNENNIETLRLRYLKNFEMKWNKMLGMMKNLRYVEVVAKDAKVMNIEKRKDQVDRVEKQEKKTEEEKEKKRTKEDRKLMQEMEIPEFTLDENGLWERDQKEVDQNKKVPKSNEAQDKVLQKKDSTKIEATTNNYVAEISSFLNMVEKGGQASSRGQPKKDYLETKANTNHDVIEPSKGVELLTWKYQKGCP